MMIYIALNHDWGLGYIRMNKCHGQDLDRTSFFFYIMKEDVEICQCTGLKTNNFQMKMYLPREECEAVALYTSSEWSKNAS